MHVTSYMLVSVVALLAGPGACLNITTVVATPGTTPPITCAKGDAPVNCFANPCSVSACINPNPNWICLPLYCTKPTTYLGNTIPGGRPCTALWFDPSASKVFACPPLPPVACPDIYHPVCGSNGKDYPNCCYAAVDGVKVAFTGLCVFPPSCSNARYNPVCDGTSTWPSACSAKYNNAGNATDGACLRGPCASCTLQGACSLPHRCKGNPKYACRSSACTTQQVLDNGTRVDYGLCSAQYYNVVTGYPAAACYP